MSSDITRWRGRGKVVQSGEEGGKLGLQMSHGEPAEGGHTVAKGCTVDDGAGEGPDGRWQE